MLQVQYRMNEHIMQFPSAYFYNNRLIADDSVRNHSISNLPVIDFVDTAGCGFNETQDPETLSRFNDDEAQLLIRQLEKVVGTSWYGRMEPYNRYHHSRTARRLSAW